jgi:serine/threonine protein kinase
MFSGTTAPRERTVGYQLTVIDDGIRAEMAIESQRALKFPQRFEVLRQIGREGMGMVFEALDRERNLRVALKALTDVSPSRLYLFKQEFRALAGIVHPNLVTLYELIEEGDEYFADRLPRMWLRAPDTPAQLIDRYLVTRVPAGDMAEFPRRAKSPHAASEDRDFLFWHVIHFRRTYESTTGLDPWTPNGSHA